MCRIFKIQLFLFFAATSFSSAAYAQLAAFTSLAKSSLDSFNTQFPQEKIYLHSDRANYQPDETIWFKVYCVTDGLPSYVSKVAYADLINSEGKVIDKKMLSLKNGTAFNNFDLPKNIASGKYILRGYTLWMLNFPDFLFTKEINIYNNASLTSNSNTRPEEINLRFFPEGGELIEGIPTLIAFKATGAGETPAEVKGYVISEDGKEIIPIKSFHDGMGSFTLNAKKNQKYYAEVIINMVQKKVVLPQAKAAGISIQVDNSGATKIFLRIERSTQNKEQLNKFYIIGQQLGQLVYSASVDFDAGKTAALINKKNLLPGILQLTLFDEAYNPVAERLVFINNLSGSDAIVFKADTINMVPRKKNTFSLQNMTSTSPSLSVSITNAASGVDSNSNHILSSILLTSDLHGKINNPAYYLKGTDSATVAALDLLMMTNGWRRFKWSGILKKKYPALTFIAEPGNVLTGNVVKAGNKNAVITDGRLDVITKAEDSTIILNTTQLSKNGDFFIPNLEFKKKAKLYFQSINLKKEKAYVLTNIYPAYIDTLQKINITNYQEFLFPSKKIPDMQTMPGNIVFKNNNGSNGKLMNEVRVISKRISKEDSVAKLYSTGLFENSDNTIVVDGNSNYFNIWQMIRSSVSGIEVTGDINSPTVFFKRYANTSNIFSSQTSADDGETANVATTNGIIYYLNEVNVSKDVIDNISLNDVALIKVFKGTSAFILGPGDGAIAIYTKNGSGASDPREKYFDMVVKTGFSVEREFYSPDYSNALTNIETDNRVTLYWNPQVKFNKSGKATISFFNADIIKKIFVNIQGFDNDGKLISIQKIIE